MKIFLRTFHSYQHINVCSTTSPEYLDQIGMDETSLNYISYIDSFLSDLQHKLHPWICSDRSVCVKKIAITNGYEVGWKGFPKLPALDLKVEPIDTSFGDQTGLKAWYNQLGNQVVIWVKMAKQLDNQPANSFLQDSFLMRSP